MDPKGIHQPMLWTDALGDHRGFVVPKPVQRVSIQHFARTETENALG